MKNFFQRVLLIFFGLTIGFGLAELAASWVLPKPLMHRFPLLKMQADLNCGYRYLPNQEGYTLESKAVINSAGFRGPERKLQKDPGVIRIVLLGDSYIFGQGAGEEETAAAQLEKILNSQASADIRYEVLNFGISGYDAGHELKALEYYALRFQPDLVFLCFFINDLFYIKNYDFYAQMFQEEERKFSPWKWQIRNWVRRSRVLMYGWDLLQGAAVQKNEVMEAIHAYAVDQKQPSAGPQQDGWHFTEERLKDFQRLAARAHFKAFLAVIPTPEEIQRGQSAPYASHLLEEGLKLGIQPVDVFAGFQKAGLHSWQRWLIPYDYHWNAAGSHIAADVFARAVSSTKQS